MIRKHQGITLNIEETEEKFTLLFTFNQEIKFEDRLIFTTYLKKKFSMEILSINNLTCQAKLKKTLNKIKDFAKSLGIQQSEDNHTQTVYTLSFQTEEPMAISYEFQINITPETLKLLRINSEKEKQQSTQNSNASNKKSTTTPLSSNQSKRKKSLTRKKPSQTSSKLTVKPSQKKRKSRSKSNSAQQEPTPTTGPITRSRSARMKHDKTQKTGSQQNFFKQTKTNSPTSAKEAPPVEKRTKKCKK